MAIGIVNAVEFKLMCRLNKGLSSNNRESINWTVGFVNHQKKFELGKMLPRINVTVD